MGFIHLIKYRCYFFLLLVVVYIFLINHSSKFQRNHLFSTPVLGYIVLISLINLYHSVSICSFVSLYKFTSLKLIALSFIHLNRVWMFGYCVIFETGGE